MNLLMPIFQICNFNPLWPRGGGRVGCHPQQVLQIFLGTGKSLFCKLNFSCRLILGTSVHEKIFKIRPTVLALELDKGRVLVGGRQPPHIEFSVFYFSNREGDIQS